MMFCQTFIPRFQVLLPGGILCFHTWCWCSTSHCNEGRSCKILGAASAASGETPPPQSVGSGDEFGSCTGGGISVLSVEIYGNLSKHDLQVAWSFSISTLFPHERFYCSPFDLMGKRYAVRLQQRVLVRTLICSFSMQCLVEAESYPKAKPAAGNRLR